MLFFEDGERIVFAGDSICASEKTAQRPLGKGYADIVDKHLRAFYPDRSIEVENIALHADSAELLRYWQTEVKLSANDHVVLLAGADEIKQSFCFTGKSADPEAYYENLNKIIELSLPSVRSFMLMTPFFIDLDPDDRARELTDRYRQLTKELAAEYMLPCVDLQKVFDKFLLYRHPLSISPDRFSPGEPGELLIAHSFLTEAGFEWSSRDPDTME